VDDELWNLAEDDLGEVVIAALSGAGLPAAHPVEVHVERLAFVYPIYDVGYEQRFDVVDGWIAKHDRVVTFGRQGLFAHDNAHHALKMAYAAVDCLQPNDGFDLARWARARESFATHVVED
jgi:protoporphyrinogen oxidase